MTSHIQVIFDFASPNGYLLMKALPQVVDKADASVSVMPCLLGGIFKATGNLPPMVAYAGVPNKMAYQGLEMRRFCERFGLTKFKMNPHFPINTILPMRVLTAAITQGSGDVVCEILSGAIWEREADISDPAVLTRELASAGLDADALLHAAVEDTNKLKLRTNTEEAVARGVFGIPTMFINDAMYFGKDKIDDVARIAGGARH